MIIITKDGSDVMAATNTCFVTDVPDVIATCDARSNHKQTFCAPNADRSFIMKIYE
jgi:hypothetical protein